MSQPNHPQKIGTVKLLDVEPIIRRAVATIELLSTQLAAAIREADRGKRWEEALILGIEDLAGRTEAELLDFIEEV